jgi:transposase
MKADLKLTRRLSASDSEFPWPRAGPLECKPQLRRRIREVGAALSMLHRRGSAVGFIVASYGPTVAGLWTLFAVVKFKVPVGSHPTGASGAPFGFQCH